MTFAQRSGYKISFPLKRKKITVIKMPLNIILDIPYEIKIFFVNPYIGSANMLPQSNSNVLTCDQSGIFIDL